MDATIVRLVEESRRGQGLPARVEDAAVLARVAHLVVVTDRRRCSLPPMTGLERDGASLPGFG